ncbi:PAS domain-containing protein [Cupriavidus basilensis]|uniref:PAS domain-containing protein n=1 Tax=Cupriavidus basilensis TaxID=68895 RepID=A0ABT6AYK4_9BURK|nr:PAS domain-containing protein [Cupriavidus basilensis]MDF3837342.1 PAS domain-containing protein [Cupriavidus basilensis]
MLTVWLYLAGAAAACGYAIAATMGWLPASMPLAAACLGAALTLVLVAAVANRRAPARLPGAIAPRPGAGPIPAHHDYRALVDGIEDIVFETDADAVFHFLNHAWKSITMLDVRVCLHTSLFRYVHPDEQALNREQFLTILSQSSDACRYETRLICHDGQLRWMEVRLRPRFDGHGQVCGTTGTMTDVHSRKRAEDVLRARDRSLSTLLDHLPGMAFRCRNDRRWTMEFVSDGCFELTGLEAVDLLNHPSYDELIHPDDRAYVWDYVQSQLAQHKAFHLRYRIRTRAGQEKWVNERSRGIFAGNGTLLAIEGFVSDISSQKRDEERAEREPLHDRLTGLKSRALLLDRIDLALQYGAPFMLLCLDVDNLKRINERHGRAFGDQLLGLLGERLAACCKAGVSAGRSGGDEFAILALEAPADPAPGLDGLARFAGSALGDRQLAGVISALTLADTIASLLDTPFEIGGASVSINARLGIALSLERYPDARTMLRDAMRAVYSAQWQSSGGTVRLAFAGEAARRSAQAWRRAVGEFARGFDTQGLQVSLAQVVPPGSGPAWAEGAACWHSARTGIIPAEHLFLHASRAGMLEALVERYLLAIYDQARPRLKPRQRLCLCLNATPLSAAVLRGLHGALAAIAGKAAPAQLDLLLPPCAEPGLTDLDAVLAGLRGNGIRLGVDLTLAAARDGPPLPDWSLLADFWRIRVGPGTQEAGRLERLLEIAARHGITVAVAGGPDTFAAQGRLLHRVGVAEPIAPDA